MSDNYPSYNTMEYLIQLVCWDTVELWIYNKLFLMLFYNLLWADDEYLYADFKCKGQKPGLSS